MAYRPYNGLWFQDHYGPPRTRVRKQAGYTPYGRVGPQVADFQRFGPPNVWMSPDEIQRRDEHWQQQRENAATMIAFELFGDNVTRREINQTRAYLIGHDKYEINPDAVRARKKARDLGTGWFL